MYLRGQQWSEDDTYIVLKLLAPYWAAWKKFGWPKDTEGISVSMDSIKYAMTKKKKLKVVVSENKYGTYEITATQALAKGSIFTTSNGTVLVCIPRTVYKKVPDEKKKLSVDDYEWDNKTNTVRPKGS